MGLYLQMTPGKDDPASALITHGIAAGLAQSVRSFRFEVLKEGRYPSSSPPLGFSGLN